MKLEKALKFLDQNETKKGNYKREAVLTLIKELCKTKNCPNCNGTGEVHSPCAFGGRGDYYKCKVCDGKGEIKCS